ncbi:MAG: LCP family protein [Chloroflexota bacterium]|nr:LCP family protein [Chloroflexota bacterium]
MRNTPSNTKKTPDWFALILVAGFIISAGITAYLAFNTGRDVATAQQEAQSPAILPTLAPTPVIYSLDENAPLQDSGNRPDSPSWDENESITVLLMGLDTRTWKQDGGAGLTDTVILATFDPQTRRAGLLSIPRDLWIEIPGDPQYSPCKINQVYMIGEGTGYPGGGPELLMDALEQFLGTTIDYYASVDFNTFIALVDAVDGVKIDVQETLIVDPSPGVDDEMKKIEPGVQVLPGGLALGYVRTRDTAEGDFGRAARQQQVLVALQQRVGNFDMIPTLIGEFPNLYREFSDGIETNLTLNQLIALGLDIKKIHSENIHYKVISPPLVEATMHENFYVLIPDPAKIRAAWDNILNPTASELAPQATKEISLKSLVAEENAQIAVYNGTSHPGLAGDTAYFLSRNGVSVPEVGNADQYAEQTFIYDYSGNPYTIKYLLEIMGLSEAHLSYRYQPEAVYDILIVLGDDWAVQNPLP